MSELSNKTLAILLVAAIMVTLTTTFYSLNKLEKFNEIPTGRATNTTGKVNLSVESALSIKLNNALIDFGRGYVNTSSSLCPTNATLTMDQAPFVNLNNCWIGMSGTPNIPTMPFLIENDGNQNATINIRGPDKATFFQNFATSNPMNLTFMSRDNETGACLASGAGLVTTWTDFTGVDQPICTKLAYSPSTGDELAVGIRVIIPQNLVAATYENSTITFTAS